MLTSRPRSGNAKPPPPKHGRRPCRSGRPRAGAPLSPAAVWRIAPAPRCRALAPSRHGRRPRLGAAAPVDRGWGRGYRRRLCGASHRRGAVRSPPPPGVAPASASPLRSAEAGATPADSTESPGDASDRRKPHRSFTCRKRTTNASTNGGARLEAAIPSSARIPDRASQTRKSFR